MKVAGTREDEGTVASRLYAILREFDADGVDAIYSESFEPGGHWGRCDEPAVKGCRTPDRKASCKGAGLRIKEEKAWEQREQINQLG